jgi:hypothetical protein
LDIWNGDEILQVEHCGSAEANGSCSARGASAQTTKDAVDLFFDCSEAARAFTECLDGYILEPAESIPGGRIEEVPNLNHRLDPEKSGCSSCSFQALNTASSGSISQPLEASNIAPSNPKSQNMAYMTTTKEARASEHQMPILGSIPRKDVNLGRIFDDKDKFTGLPNSTEERDSITAYGNQSTRKGQPVLEQVHQNTMFQVPELQVLDSFLHDLISPFVR